MTPCTIDLWRQPFLSMCWGRSQLTLTAHQVVVAFQLLQQSFLSVRGGTFLFLINANGCEGTKSSKVLSSQGTIHPSSSVMPTLRSPFLLQEQLKAALFKNTCSGFFLCVKTKGTCATWGEALWESLVTTGSVLCLTEEWSSMGRGGAQRVTEWLPAKTTDVMDDFNNFWLFFSVLQDLLLLRSNLIMMTTSFTNSHIPLGVSTDS